MNSFCIIGYSLLLLDSVMLFFEKKKKVILLFCNVRLLLLLYLLPVSGLGIGDLSPLQILQSFITFVLEKVTNSRNYPVKKHSERFICEPSECRNFYRIILLGFHVFYFVLFFLLN